MYKTKFENMLVMLEKLEKSLPNRYKLLAEAEKSDKLRSHVAEDDSLRSKITAANSQPMETSTTGKFLGYTFLKAVFKPLLSFEKVLIPLWNYYQVN